MQLILSLASRSLRSVSTTVQRGSPSHMVPLIFQDEDVLVCSPRTLCDCDRLSPGISQPGSAALMQLRVKLRYTV